MARDSQPLKPVPVRRRSAARLAAIQVCYQALMSGKSAARIAPEFLELVTSTVRDLLLAFRAKLYQCSRDLEGLHGQAGDKRSCAQGLPWNQPKQGVPGVFRRIDNAGIRACFLFFFLLALIRTRTRVHAVTPSKIPDPHAVAALQKVGWDEVYAVRVHRSGACR